MRIKQIAFYEMLLMASAAAVLVLHCVPITESKEMPAWWYLTVYYFLLSISAILGGAMVSVVAMIYAALVDVVNVLGRGQDDSSLIYSQPNES